VGYYGPSGKIYKNGTNIATIQTYAIGNRVDVAYDTTALLIWFRTNGGNWNNNGTNNPATGQGGIALSGITSPSPAQCGAFGTQTTTNFGFSPFSGTVPSGFAALATQGPSAASMMFSGGS